MHLNQKIKNLIEMVALSFEMLRYAYATLSMTTLDQLFCGVLLTNDTMTARYAIIAENIYFILIK
ncbi:hypothetical protein RIVM261_037280 [Rivularia sp. IAM M-261]|nr:hypothetical protein CAL7716_076280 [Calothrix sp. PCC 7716]GJD18772.1 hypothetical protein RIVM261_037280 [Rivularia sp. IAM M-261]